MGSSGPPVSDAELDVLKVLWPLGPATVREVEARLRKRRRRWAYTTVLTLLSRLREKGYVTSDKPAGGEGGGGGTAYVFRAAVSRDQLLADGLTDLADRICDGTASPLVHALVKGQNLTANDIADLRKLLDDLERKE
jgi:BlaI family transcriptional regulator, penicillinase repressor